jgi:hypothetical protein
MTGPGPWEAVRRINRAAWPAEVKNLARALLQWRDGATGELYPALRTVAAALGVAESTARQYVAAAVKHGALEVVGACSGGRTPTRYRLVLPESPPANPPDSGGIAPKVNPPDSGVQPTGFRRPTHRIPAPILP